MYLSLKNFLIIVLIYFIFSILTVLTLQTSSSKTLLIHSKNPSKSQEESSSSNEFFLSSLKPENLESESTCKTHQNKYTPTEIKNIFNYQDYSACKTPTNDTISFKNSQILIQCIKTTTPQYADDYNRFETYGGSRKHRPSWSNTTPSITNKEFLFIKCSEDAIYALVFNRFKQEFSDSANQKRRKLGFNKKPMSVLLLVFDSISRYSFQRNLPKTRKFLQGLEANQQLNQVFSLYEFEKAASVEVRTRWNMAQILYGKSLNEVDKGISRGKQGHFKRMQDLKDYQKHAIWTHFKSLGYVTMFSHGTVMDDLSLITGKYLATDHTFTNFWRYLWGIYNWYDTQEGQKCAGNRNFHDFSLDYTFQFFDNYQDNNKFAYVHINAAHEESGNVKTIDEDLFRFLNEFLSMIQNKGENLALFLISDHGYKQIKGAQWDIRSFFEYNTPMTHLIVSKEVVTGLEADSNLKYNQRQLVSRYDINLSLKHLAYFPYNISLESWYSAAKDDYTYNTMSLFQEKSNNNRTCADIGVSKEFCLCSWYEPIEYSENERIIQIEMINLFANLVENLGSPKGKCKVEENVYIVKAENFVIKNLENGLDTLYNIRMKTRQASEIFVDFNFCLENRINKTQQILNGVYKPYSVFQLEIGKVFLQLSDFKMSTECLTCFCDC